MPYVYVHGVVDNAIEYLLLNHIVGLSTILHHTYKSICHSYVYVHDRRRSRVPSF